MTTSGSTPATSQSATVTPGRPRSATDPVAEPGQVGAHDRAPDGKGDTAVGNRHRGMDRERRENSSHARPMSSGCRPGLISAKASSDVPSGKDATHDRRLPQPLARALRSLRRHPDDRARHDDRERRAAVDQGRPRVLRDVARMGRQRLPAHLRRLPPARRAARRPLRPPPAVPDRHRALHRSRRSPAGSRARRSS